MYRKKQMSFELKKTGLRKTQTGFEVMRKCAEDQPQHLLPQPCEPLLPQPELEQLLLLPHPQPQSPSKRSEQSC